MHHVSPDFKMPRKVSQVIATPPSTCKSCKTLPMDWHLGKVCHDLLHMAAISQQLPFWRHSMVNTSSPHKPSLQTSIQQEFLLKWRQQKISSSGSTLYWEQENCADLVKVLEKTWASGLSSGRGARGRMAVLHWALLGPVSRTVFRAVCRTETCWSWVYF